MKRSHMRAGDTLRVGTAGLIIRPARVVLSALGIAIGVAAMLAVLGISASSRADLDRSLARLGANMLTVAPGEHVYGGQASLPADAAGRADRLPNVQAVSAVARLDAAVYRNDHFPVGQTGSIAVYAVHLDLDTAVALEVWQGRWLNQATAEHPAVVLGAVAAQRLGIRQPGVRVWLGGNWFSVTGILAPVPLARELDAAALIGWPIATRLLQFDGHPTALYTRVEEPAVEQLRRLLPATVNPQHPEEIRVSRPSDALYARRATDRVLTGLLTGLGAVALVVGGIGIANTMIISVLERRQEIGLRRALGATKAHIRRQFLTESVLLSLLGGLAGTLLGILVTGAFAWTRGWPVMVPWWATLGGVCATLLIGPIAGLYPAVRAARLSPTTALAA